MADAFLTHRGKHKSELHGIAYLDLLGSTAKISSEKSDFYLGEIYSIYEAATIFTKKQYFSKFGFNQIKIKIFSDNIVIAMPLYSHNDDVNRIECLLNFVSIIQNQAVITHSWLVRGGITIGELFLDDMLVWGTGLVHAYKLESNVAKYPRIIIDREIFNAYVLESPSFCQDDDGYYFLDFLNSVSSFDAHGNDNSVQLAKTSYLQLLDNVKISGCDRSEKVYEKLRWYGNYINSWYREKYPSDTYPLIDISVIN